MNWHEFLKISGLSKTSPKNKHFELNQNAKDILSNRIMAAGTSRRILQSTRLPHAGQDIIFLFDHFGFLR
jgi:hypothetical protein